MSQELHKGAILNGNYIIEQVLGQGGFGITYRAYDKALKRYVAIKEYFPGLLCSRDKTTSHVTPGTEGAKETYERYKTKFFKEAQSIVNLNHPSIIRVFAAFEENGTAYYVMEYIDGESLKDIVERQGPLSVQSAVEYIRGVGDALGYIHHLKMNHLDVKPANIMVRRSDNRPILIDFGLSKHYDEKGNQTTTTPLGVSHGYAPMEQYGGVQKLSPETDLYSLAATLYFLLTGVTPPNAFELKPPLAFPAYIPMQLQTAITKAMAANPADRYPSVAAFFAALFSQQPSQQPKADDNTVMDGAKHAPQPAPRPVSPRPNPIPRKPNPPIGIPDKPKKIDKRIFLLGGGGLVAVLAVVLVIAFWPKADPGPSEQELPTTEQPTSESAPQPTTEEQAGLHYNESTSELILGSNRYKMVKVDGGSFDMGATPEQVDANDWEKPVHSVTLSSYSIGQTEVPQWLWVAVMGNNPSDWKGDNLPVECVSWKDCQTFINEINSITGKNFSLPTEAQWEFAARGGNRSRGYQYSGSNRLSDVAWYRDNSGRKTHGVGTKRANELGLYDMSGNVWEWCSDWYGSYPKGSVTDPKGPSSGSRRVYRGGGWRYTPMFCRVAYRICNAPGVSSLDLGFRLVL